MRAHVYCIYAAQWETQNPQVDLQLVEFSLDKRFRWIRRKINFYQDSNDRIEYMKMNVEIIFTHRHIYSDHNSIYQKCNKWFPSPTFYTRSYIPYDCVKYIIELSLTHNNQTECESIRSERKNDYKLQNGTIATLGWW